MMPERIKILFTTSNFQTAGSGKVIYDLVNGLNRDKFEIEIACGHDRGQFFKTVEALGYPMHIVDTKTSYRPYLTLFSRTKIISKFFKRHNYDIVHSWQWSNDWTEALAARLAGSKWIYTKKAMGFHNKHWKIKSFLAHFIITINDDMKYYFPNKKNQKLIPLGIDTTYYSPLQFKGNPDSKLFKIITVANLVPVKGIEVLINALNTLKNDSVHLTILGAYDNEYGQYLKKLCKDLKMNHRIVFVGKKPDVRPYLAASNLYVIPTLDEGRKEGMPMALVEAMSMGIPVLGSNISGIKFVLQSFPELLFEPGNPIKLREKIEMIRSSSLNDRKEIGEKLRHYCIENFELNQNIEAHQKLYFELMNLQYPNA